MKYFFNNETSEEIWKDRYRKNNETLQENFSRVAKFCAKDSKEEEDFLHLMNDGYFFPAGRTMSNSGIGKNLTLNNCFVASQIGDSYDDIFDKVKLGAITHQRGGGIGYDVSQLRPKGSPTSNGAVASGAVSFLDMFNAQTETTIQGNRRGANMGVMNVYSLDIETFIDAKATDASKLNHFNLSVMVDDDFITAVRNDEDVWLHHPVYNEEGKIEKDSKNWIYKKKVSAKYIWDKIMRRAYDNGEPGVFFYDNLNKDNNLWYIENIVCSNPCSEYLAGTIYGNSPLTGEKLNPKDFGGACNLGSLFLHNFVIDPFTKDARIDFDNLKNAIYGAVRMLDNIIDVNTFPSEVYENYQRNFRTIGLGFTGLGDTLAMCNLKYDSREARMFVDSLVEFIAFNAYKASVELAKERGSFPFLDREKFIQSGYILKHCKEKDSEWRELKEDILKYGIRNAKILSVAPTGTLSMVFGNNCSSGLEPIFSLEYDRKVKVGGQTDDKIKVIKMRDYAYGLWLDMKDDPKNIVKEDVFVTALEMGVDSHVNMLGVIAKHIDMSCSKTINVPESYSFEDTKNIYLKCHDLGIKGCTIFRPNPLRQGILITGKQKKVEPVVCKDAEKLERGMIIKADDNCVGKKRTLQTGCGTLHCQAWFDPDTGALLETYLSKGGSGGCNNFMIGLSRLISLSARGGIDIYSIVDQLKSSGTCPSYATRTATKHDTSKGASCPIAVGNALIDMYKEMQKEVSDDTSYDDQEIVVVKTIEKPAKAQENDMPKCPECGEPLIFEGGCNTCKSCGYSKCS